MELSARKWLKINDWFFAYKFKQFKQLSDIALTIQTIEWHCSNNAFMSHLLIYVNKFTQ